MTESLVWFDDPKKTADAPEDWEPWLKERFPHVTKHPFGARHRRLWEWFQSLRPGEKPLPRIEVWPRGGAKSTTCELAVAYLAFRLTRRYCLIVSETQDQADKHVSSIASLMEKAGMERDINKYGNSKGWRRNQLRTANGFNVESLGLDTAARGIKLDEFRPDLIIFDDIDHREDSEKATEKKERSVKDSIIPAGSSDVAVLFLQNLIIEDGIVAKLADDRADFLLTREIPEIEPAVKGLQTEAFDRGDGVNQYKIVAGTPTWEGQSLEICEAQINEWGLTSFLREAQHEVKDADGVFFKTDNVRYCGGEDDAIKLPQRFKALARAWDFAGTEGAGDYTVGTLMGLADNGVRGDGGLKALKYKLDVVRGQWSSEVWEEKVLNQAVEDKKEWGEVVVVIPQDPGQAGKFQVATLRRKLERLGIKVVVRPTSGRKALRAGEYQKDYNLGNVVYRRAAWNKADTEEHRRFREDESHKHDDIVDSSSDAHFALQRPSFGVASR